MRNDVVRRTNSRLRTLVRSIHRGSHFEVQVVAVDKELDGDNMRYTVVLKEMA